jgi:hypothetical protein
MMPHTAAPLARRIELDGFAILRGVFDSTQIDQIAAELSAALSASAAAIRGKSGTLHAARNILTVWPAVATVWQVPALVGALAEVLGGDYGLVRVLYFDKPPGQSWALPWHKDMTIAVKDNRRPSRHFGKPTRKAGVPHVEAPEDLLNGMLTARVHLDSVTDENGPLKVLPGSHRFGKSLGDDDGAVPQAIHVERGDVLLMRPLLVHASGKSQVPTKRHRRVLHLEFAAVRHLPDGFAWHDFVR